MDQKNDFILFHIVTDNIKKMSFLTGLIVSIVYPVVIGLQHVKPLFKAIQ